MDGSLQKQDGVLSVLVTHIEAAPALPSEHPVFVPSPRGGVGVGAAPPFPSEDPLFVPSPWGGAGEGAAPSLPSEDVFPDSRNYR
jgi:hypothetical protein